MILKYSTADTELYEVQIVRYVCVHIHVQGVGVCIMNIYRCMYMYMGARVHACKELEMNLIRQQDALGVAVVADVVRRRPGSDGFQWCCRIGHGTECCCTLTIYM